MTSWKYMRYLALLGFSFYDYSHYFIIFFLFLLLIFLLIKIIMLMQTWRLQKSFFFCFNRFQNTTIVKTALSSLAHYTDCITSFHWQLSIWTWNTHISPSMMTSLSRPISLSRLRLIVLDVFRGVNRTRALTSSLSTTGAGRSRVSRSCSLQPYTYSSTGARCACVGLASIISLPEISA